jgi:hypothetical protein
VSQGGPSARNEQEAGARLHIRVADPAIITPAVGVDPDESWHAGQTRPWGGLPAKFGSWRLVEDEIGVPESSYFGDAVERCLRRLFARISPAEFRRRLARLDPELSPAIVLTGFVREFPNIALPADLVGKIAELGASIEEDFYPLPTDSKGASGS